MKKFFNTPFLRKNIPTLNGINSKDGYLHLVIAPTTDDENKIRINLITKDKNGESYGSVCTLVSSDTAKMLAYQLIETFDIPLSETELDKAKQMSEEYYSQFPYLKGDIKDYPVLNII